MVDRLVVRPVAADTVVRPVAVDTVARPVAVDTVVRRPADTVPLRVVTVALLPAAWADR